MDAYAVLLQACQRQDGVTKQKNASNYFATALLSKRTRPITLQRLYQAKERVQLLSTAFSRHSLNPIRFSRPVMGRSAVQPVQFEQPVEFISRQPKKDCRPAPIAVALF